jgi:hypothetical protein
MAKKPMLEAIPNPNIVPLPTRALSERAQHAVPSQSVSQLFIFRFVLSRVLSCQGENWSNVKHGGVLHL